jgi:hypothetical protein
VKASDWAGWRYIQLTLTQNNNSSSYDLWDATIDTTGTFPDEAFIEEKLLRTEPLMFDSEAVSYVRIYLEIGFEGDATGTGQIDMSLFQLQEVDTSFANHKIKEILRPNVGFDADSHYKTYVSGLDVESIWTVDNLSTDDGFTLAAATHEPVYNSSYLATRGALVTSSTVLERLLDGYAVPTDGNMTVAFAATIPSSPASNCDIYFYGQNGTSGIGDARFVILASNGNARWFNDSTGTGNINFGQDWRGKTILGVVSLYDDGANLVMTAHIRERGQTTVVASGNAQDIYTGGTYNRAVTGAGGTAHHEMWFFKKALEQMPLTAEQILDDMESRF